jgi:hypothetical protein
VTTRMPWQLRLELVVENFFDTQQIQHRNVTCTTK